MAAISDKIRSYQYKSDETPDFKRLHKIIEYKWRGYGKTVTW